MATKYIPKWKDNKGNILVLRARNHIFDTENEAREFQIADFIFYVPFRLGPAGVLEVDINEQGTSELVHVEADMPYLGTVLLIEGPLLEEQLATQGGRPL